jgi:large subunit ribosomal protein L22
MTKRKYYCPEAKHKKTAQTMAKNQPASLKYTTELIHQIKGKPINKAIQFLEDIIEQKRYLPLKKYKKKIGHRKGTAQNQTKTGRYPKKTAQIIIKILQTLQANADYKGMDKENLILKNAFTSQGHSKITHQTQGRISGKQRKKKSIHIEAIAVEGKK